MGFRIDVNGGQFEEGNIADEGDRRGSQQKQLQNIAAEFIPKKKEQGGI